MFDIGFSEIVVIGVVALVVIGPEKLPRAARTLGHLFGRMQRYVNDVKSDISREMELDELRKLQQEVHSAARELETSMTSAVNEVQAGARSVEQELNQGAAEDTATPALTDPAAPAPPAGAVQHDTGTAQQDVDAARHGIGAVQQDAAAPAPDQPPVRQARLPGLEQP